MRTQSAIAQDATTIFFNPAGMTKLPSQMETAVHVIIPSFKFKNEGSTRTTGALLLGGNEAKRVLLRFLPISISSKKLAINLL